MITQIFTQNSMKIISLFSMSPGSRFNRKQIKEKTRINNVPLDNSLLRLTSSGILRRERNYYAVNFEDEYSRKILDICSKQFKHLKELPLSVYYIMMDLADYFSVIKGAELILFGSYAKLVYTDKSDVDIALLYGKSPDKKKINIFASSLEKTYNKRIEPHYFKKMVFYKNKKDPLVKSIIKDGVRIV